MMLSVMMSSTVMVPGTPLWITARSNLDGGAADGDENLHEIVGVGDAGNEADQQIGDVELVDAAADVGEGPAVNSDRIPRLIRRKAYDYARGGAGSITTCAFDRR